MAPRGCGDAQLQLFCLSPLPPASSTEEDPVVHDAPACFPLPSSPGGEVGSNLCTDKPSSGVNCAFPVPSRQANPMHLAVESAALAGEAPAAALARQENTWPQPGPAGPRGMEPQGVAKCSPWGWDADGERGIILLSCPSCLFPSTCPKPLAFPLCPEVFPEHPGCVVWNQEPFPWRSSLCSC